MINELLGIDSNKNPQMHHEPSVIDVAREYFPNKPERYLWFVIWEETGYPQFWNIPQDGNTPEECFRKQLKDAAKFKELVLV